MPDGVARLRGIVGGSALRGCADKRAASWVALALCRTVWRVCVASSAALRFEDAPTGGAALAVALCRRRVCVASSAALRFEDAPTSARHRRRLLPCAGRCGGSVRHRGWLQAHGRADGRGNGQRMRRQARRVRCRVDSVSLRRVISLTPVQLTACAVRRVFACRRGCLILRPCLLLLKYPLPLLQYRLMRFSRNIVFVVRG